MIASIRLAARLAAALVVGWLASAEAGHAAGAPLSEGVATDMRDAVVQHARKALQDRALMRRARVVLALRLMGLHGREPVARGPADGRTDLVRFRSHTIASPILLPLNVGATPLDFGPMVLPPEAE